MMARVGHELERHLDRALVARMAVELINGSLVASEEFEPLTEREAVKMAIAVLDEADEQLAGRPGGADHE